MPAMNSRQTKSNECALIPLSALFVWGHPIGLSALVRKKRGVFVIIAAI